MSESASDDRIIAETGLEARIAHIVEPVIAGLGYRLVRVKLSSLNGGTLQIMAERPDGTMSVKDCEALSRDISPALDAEDPLDHAYHLEVSSPGIDRPLVRRSDFVRWAGRKAKIELARPQGGRKRFKGVIAGVDGDAIRLKMEESERDQPTLATLPFAEIAEAHLLPSDAIIRETLRKEKRAPRATDHADA